ncbi:hypothetical protein, partial [Carboxylicivirga marina]|uniref:hypothetical protein n=1 Tax=Carboxylicivirga marina TaxID=2800988 RepID=UPI001F34642F
KLFETNDYRVSSFNSANEIRKGHRVLQSAGFFFPFLTVEKRESPRGLSQCLTRQVFILF